MSGLENRFEGVSWNVGSNRGLAGLLAELVPELLGVFDGTGSTKYQFPAAPQR
jgi:hypothetical protein